MYNNRSSVAHYFHIRKLLLSLTVDFMLSDKLEELSPQKEEDKLEELGC